jgi:hypothetical protein
MGRAIQPFATLNDGDVLFAASTCEIENPDLHPTDLGTVASEVMWDAVLHSVPEIPKEVAEAHGLAEVASWQTVAGRYGTSPDVRIEITPVGDAIAIRNGGHKDIFGIAPGQSVEARCSDGRLFRTNHLFLPAVGFRWEKSQLKLLLNPGPWQQAMDRQS